MSNSDNPYGVSYGGGWSASVNQTQEPNSQPDGAQAGSQVEQASTPAGGLIGDLAGGKQKAEPVLDITTAQFMPDVVEYSKSKPVLVDFWAPWCGPCKQLTPALEAAVAKAEGKVRLVKMNIDEHPDIAGQMGIQSIPAVVAFVDGQPRDAFMGAKNEKEIDQFIEKLVGPSGPSALEEALAQADELMAAEEYGQAAHIFGEIIRQIPENKDALAGYGMAALKTGAIDQAKQALANAGDASGHQALEALKAAIDLQEQADSVGDFAELESAVEADPANHQARLDLAIALNGAGKRETAADHLLEIIRRDREWNDGAARAQLLQFFEAWGAMDAETLSARRKLSSLLFS